MDMFFNSGKCAVWDYEHRRNFLGHDFDKKPVNVYETIILQIANFIVPQFNKNRTIKWIK